MDSIRAKVEKRAYELFLARGGLHGYHIQDWVQAEKDVMGDPVSKKKVGAASPSADSAPKGRKKKS